MTQDFNYSIDLKTNDIGRYVFTNNPIFTSKLNLKQGFTNSANRIAGFEFINYIVFTKEYY